MVDFNIDIQANAANAQRTFNGVNKSLKTVERTADRTRAIVGSVFAGLGVAGGITEIVNLADTYTQLQNRIRVVTDSQQELDSATQSLFDIAQKTRSTFEGTAEMYSRLSLASRELGVTQDETLQFTESLNQAIISSGVTAREANAGLIQLSQGIASNALRGDELRSVLEQLPVVADVIAKEMGVTRGALRDLGSEGMITGEVIISAFQNSKDELEALFNKTIPTLQQSFAVLRNAIIKTFGELDTGIGTTRSMSSVIIDLAGNMDVAARAAISLSVALAINLAANAIPRVISAMNTLTAVMLRNPFTALAVGITLVIGYLVGFSDRIFLTETSIVSLRDVFSAFIAESSAGIATFAGVFTTKFNFIAEHFKTVVDFLNIGLEGWLIVGARTADDFVELFFKAFLAIKALWNNLPATIDTIFSRAFNHAAGNVEAFLNNLIRIITNSKLGALLGFGDSSFKIQLPEFEVGNVSTVKDLAKAVSDAFNEDLGLDETEQFINRVLERSKEVAKARIAAKNGGDEDTQPTLALPTAPAIQIDSGFDDLLKKLKQEGELLRLNSREREIQQGLFAAETTLKRDLTAAEEDLVASILTENQLLQDQSNMLDGINSPIVEYQTTLAALNTLLKEGAINQTAFNVALAGTSLAQSVSQLQTDLNPDSSATQVLQDQLMERQFLIQQAQDARFISEQEALALSIAANKAYNDSIMEMEQKKFLMQTSAAGSTAKSLAQITSGLAGDQSSAYKAMFAVSKGFAVADATVQIAGAIAKASNTPWPANLAAIATVAAQTASIVSTIQSTNISGFKNGGSFGVGGSGGTDSQLVQFKASPNETVSVRTPGQERQAAGQTAQAAPPEVKVNNINVLDPSIVEDFLSSSQGEQVLVNSIQRNSSQVAELLRRI